MGIQPSIICPGLVQTLPAPPSSPPASHTPPRCPARRCNAGRPAWQPTPEGRRGRRQALRGRAGGARHRELHHGLRSAREARRPGPLSRGHAGIDEGAVDDRLVRSFVGSFRSARATFVPKRCFCLKRCSCSEAVFLPRRGATYQPRASAAASAAKRRPGFRCFARVKPRRGVTGISERTAQYEKGNQCSRE